MNLLAFFEGWMGLFFWVVIAAILLAVEASTPSFFLIWFAGGALVAAILALFHVSFFIQTIIFLLSSMVLLALGRPIVKKFINKNKRPEPSNVYSIIGAKAIVLKPVDQMNGKVKIMNTGELWSAYTFEHFEIIEEGSQVIVKEVDGAKLVVVPRSAYNAQGKGS